jgi:hypothetical protein
MSARYLYGDTRPLVVTIATAQAVAPVDIVGMASNTLVRASDTTWNTDLATTQAAFRTTFLGVSGQNKRATTDTKPYGNSTDNTCRVDSDGVYEFDCASATFEVGAFVGPAKQSGNLLENQKVVGVADEAHAIGQVVERGTSITKVKVKLLSYLNPAAARA